MKRFVLKIAALVLTFSLGINMFVGCTKKEAPGENAGEASRDNTSETIKFPLETQITLKYWVPNNMPLLKSYSESPFYKELQKRTNIKLDFVHPGASSAIQELNLMIASGEYPDIIESGIDNLPGEGLKAYKDKVIIDLTDSLSKYAPNYAAVLAKYPVVKADLESEEKILTFALIRGGSNLRSNLGGIIRNDWLNDLGLKQPTTIDEWYTALKDFKEKKNAKAPLAVTTSQLIDYDYFTSAFDFRFDYFLDNGKVKYGPADQRYKEFLKTMRKWYVDGVLDPEFPSNTANLIDAKVTGGQAGAVWGSVSAIQKYELAMKDKDTKFDMIGLQYPSLKAGTAPRFMVLQPIVEKKSGGACITTACKYVKEAMALLDYGYSKEGNLLFNFGTEGESYKMVNGYPTYTDLIMANPDGYAASQIGRNYARAFGSAPFVMDVRYGEQMYGNPRQQESLKNYVKFSKEAYEANTWIKGTPTEEENNKIVPIQAELATYAKEMLLKFILGQEPIENFDNYIERLNKLGVNEVIKTKQDIYDRYIKRYPELANQKEVNVSDFYKN